MFPQPTPFVRGVRLLLFPRLDRLFQRRPFGAEFVGSRVSEFVLQSLDRVRAAGELPQPQLQLPNLLIERLPSFIIGGDETKRFFVRGGRGIQK